MAAPTSTQLFNSSENRLARALLLLARFGKEGAAELVIPKISQETLAEMIGTNRSRVSFFMNRLRKLSRLMQCGQFCTDPLPSLHPQCQMIRKRLQVCGRKALLDSAGVPRTPVGRRSNWNLGIEREGRIHVVKPK